MYCYLQLEILIDLCQRLQLELSVSHISQRAGRPGFVVINPLGLNDFSNLFGRGFGPRRHRLHDFLLLKLPDRTIGRGTEITVGHDIKSVLLEPVLDQFDS